MGTKFANFSILNISLEETINLLVSIPQHKWTLEQYNSFDKKLLPAYWKPPGSETAKLMEEISGLLDLFQRTFYVGTNGKWVTVFNDDSGTSAEANAKALSRFISKTFLLVSNFDDSIFTLAIIKDGESLARHVSGETEAYDVPGGESPGILEIIASTFDILNKKEELARVLTQEDIFQKISDLEQLFNMKLWIVHAQEAREMGWKRVTIPEAAK